MAWWVASTVSGILLAGLAVLLWVRRPPAPLWPHVFVCQLLGLLWVGGDLWASAAPSLPHKHVALALLFSGSLFLVPAWWATLRRYVAAQGLGRAWLESRWAEIPLAWAVASWLVVITNPWHGWVLTPVLGARNQYHAGMGIIAYPGYALMLGNAGLCVWAAVRHPRARGRRRMAVLAGATLGPLLVHLVHLLMPELGPRLDPTAIGLGVSGAVILYGISRERLFHLLPAAIPEILRRTPTGVVLLDRSGRLRNWNPAAARLLEGIPFEPDAPWLELLCERTGGAGLAAARAAEPSAVAPVLLRQPTRDGDRWLRLRVDPIASRRGRVKAMVVLVEDVTELREAELRQRRLEDEIDRLAKLESLKLTAGGLAHDLNNLLTVIRGNVDLALGAVSDGATLRECLEEIREAAARVGELSRQLQASARGTGSVRVLARRAAAEAVRPPAGARPVALPGEPGGSRKAEAAWGHGKILVVDDEPGICRVARAILEGAGFEVLCATGGAEAVAVFRRHARDIRLVLLDLHMPGMGGLEALQLILEVDPDVRVLCMSGHLEARSGDVIRAGAPPLLRKPYAAAELLAKVGEVLEPRAAARPRRSP